MLIDVNMYLGHYPFRKTQNQNAAELVKLMEEYSIDQSCLGSLSGVYYRDVMQGNYELLEDIKDFRDYFIPICNINPVYARAKDDLKECILKYGFKGIRLFPRQHGYRLDCPEAIDILKTAADYGVPVQLPIYIEDPRQRHPMDYVEPVSLEEIKNAALQSDKTDIMLTNFYHQLFAEELYEISRKRSGKIGYDIGRTDCLSQDSFAELYRYAGIDHICFGTGAPLQYIDVQLVKLAFLPSVMDLNEQQINKLKSENAISWFHLG